MKQLKLAAEKRPVTAAMVLLLLCVLLRLNDIFVLRIDELWGEIIVSKSLGFALVIAYVWGVNRSLRSIGLHRTGVSSPLLLGFGITAAVYAAAYLFELAVLELQGQNPRLLLSAIDPKQGVSGGVVFALWLLIGNAVNSFMEEGLFRGLLIPKLLARYSFVVTNAIQGVLFGLWHLVWPAKDVLLNQVTVPAAVTESTMLFLATTLNGLIWGYLYYKTGSLWTAWGAHTTANTVLNLLHIRSSAGLDATIAYRGAAAILLGLLGVWLVSRLAVKRQWKVVQPWQ